MTPSTTDLSPFPPHQHRVLPMAGRTHGNRSAVTCHLRCGDACFVTAPNTTETTYFRDVAATALSRRTVLGGGHGGGPRPRRDGRARRGRAAPRRQPDAATAGRPGPRAPLQRDRAVADDRRRRTVPAGLRVGHDHPLGRPALQGLARASTPTNQTGRAQAQQFGYNNDYLDIIETNRDGTRALLVCNHEYTNEGIMFPPGTDPAEVIRTAWAAHGMSVVELERRSRGRRWSYVKGGRKNRRITLDTVFTVDGPAAGSALLKTAADSTGTQGPRHDEQLRRRHHPVGHRALRRGELQPVLQGHRHRPREKRYGLAASGDVAQLAVARPALGRHDPAYANEPNRFGWIVEVDPTDPRSTPVKHTAMGRFKHEGANVIINGDGRVVAYMGDDERFDYVYRFVSRDTYRPGRPAQGPQAQPDPAQQRRPVSGAVHRRRSRGRRQRRHRRVAPADRRRPVRRPGLLDRGGARLHPAGRGRRRSRPRWTGPRTSSPTCSTAASTSRAPTTPTAARRTRRARPSPTRARPTRTATSSR